MNATSERVMDADIVCRETARVQDGGEPPSSRRREHPSERPFAIEGMLQCSMDHATNPDHMTRTAIVLGTGLRNADGSSRSRVIRRRCQLGSEVVFRKDAAGEDAAPSVAVFLGVPRLFGLLGASYAQIGYLDRQAAASIAVRLESGAEVRARVKSVYAPEEKDSPRVSLILE